MLRETPRYSKVISGSLKTPSLLCCYIRPNSLNLTRFTITPPTRTFRKTSQTNRSFSFSHYQNQHESQGNSESNNSSSLKLKLVAGLASIFSVYAVSTYTVWSLQETNPSIYKAFDQYIPLGHQILEFLEERQYQEKLRTRKQFYESQNSIQPYISKSYHNEEQHDKRSHSKATSSSSSESSTKSRTEDPLSPERFFDAKSGTVGLGERDYLPLILLPDIRDPIIHDISMSLNVLISSVNASAVSDETVNNVAELFHRLSEDIKSQQHLEKDSQLFQEESQIFTSLVENFKQVRPSPTSSDEIESRLYRQYAENYHKRLSNEILKAERILVSHCNARNATNKQNTSSPATKSSPFSFRSKQPITSSSSNPLDFSLTTPDILELQISFTLLVSALHNQSNLPISSYIQGIKSTIASSSSPNKEQLVQQALQGVRIPEDVDISPIIQDVLSDYK